MVTGSNSFSKQKYRLNSLDDIFVDQIMFNILDKGGDVKNNEVRK